jgi:protein-disulfide isomerase
MVVAILAMTGAAAVVSAAGAKPTSKHSAQCAKSSKSKAKRAKRGAKCHKEASGPVGEVTSLLRGIPEEHETLGNPRAPVTLQYFGDLECPSCKYFTIRILPTLINEFVRPGKLKIEYHSFKSYTPELSVFEEQQVAALAAGQQDKMWYFVELFYHEQGEEDSGYVTEAYLQGLAKQVPGLNLAQWTADRSNGEWEAILSQDNQEANNRSFKGTPSFLVGPSSGTLKPLEYSSVGEESSFTEAIEPLVKAS